MSDDFEWARGTFHLVHGCVMQIRARYYDVDRDTRDYRCFIVASEEEEEVARYTPLNEAQLTEETQINEKEAGEMRSEMSHKVLDFPATDEVGEE